MTETILESKGLSGQAADQFSVSGLLQPVATSGESQAVEALRHFAQ
jgi:hypothetical protein